MLILDEHTRQLFQHTLAKPKSTKHVASTIGSVWLGIYENNRKVTIPGQVNIF